MSSPEVRLESVPSDVIAWDEANGSVSMRVDASLYPLEAVYAAAYVFIDRCFVFLDKPEPEKIRVSLAAKKGVLEGEAVRDIVGEFANELLSCAWRAQIARENRSIIEAVTAQALSGARGAPSLDELEAFDFSDETFEDPLGIAMSWEEKYAKKKDGKAEPKPEAAAAPAPQSEEAK